MRTGISGPGIKHVYLPPVPPPTEIAGVELSKQKQKFYKTPLPKDYGKWAQMEANDPDLIHPAKSAFDTQEWHRRLNGYWFYNNGIPTYITGLHYFYLNYWKLKFPAEYRETNKEVFYWFQFIEEDPNCYGGCYNTKRRDGKSSMLGCWIAEPILRNKQFNGGLQDRTHPHAKKFFRENIANPFRKLIPTFQPEYDTSSTQKEEIYLTKRIKRGQKIQTFFDEDENLESRLDCRASNEEAYDGEKLHRYGVEEPGKRCEADVYNRHDVVKWCCYENGEIIGKMLYATTVELDDKEEDNKAYRRLYYDSDYDVRPALNQTTSGLYSAFMPAYYADKYDAYGHPLWQKQKADLDERRAALKDDPKKYAKFVRKFPYTIGESFYTVSTKSVFNIVILEARKSELELQTNIVHRGDFKWVDGIKDSKAWFDPNPRGKWKVAYLFENQAESNRFRWDSTQESFIPLNESKFRRGIDPIQHGIVNDMGKASKPVSLIKRLYDGTIDPSGDLLELAESRYPYKTNKYVSMYDHRPKDPKIFYEDMIIEGCYWGTSMHAENQKNSIINYFNERGYRRFVMKRPEATITSKGQLKSEGTPASTPIIQQYTDLLQTYVEYFGHTIPFLEVVEDLIRFDPNNTQFFDYAVSMGFTELGCLVKFTEEKTTLTIEDLLPVFDQYGNFVR